MKLGILRNDALRALIHFCIASVVIFAGFVILVQTLKEREDFPQYKKYFAQVVAYHSK